MNLSNDFCPFCTSSAYITIGKNLKHCKKCKYVLNAGYSPLCYDSSYFLDEYKEQYGKSYEDDFQQIYSLSKKRLQKIFDLNAVLNKEKSALLDIGAALGIFLKCALDYGIEKVSGIEISEYAAQYALETYNIHIKQSSFEDCIIEDRYDIITAWFFIEHCENPINVFKQIYEKLNPGGILAMSVPSIYGPSFIFNRDRWVESHPQDHRIDFSPAFIRMILKKIGFKKVHVKPAGFHPERILAGTNPLFKIFSSLYRLFSLIFKFSDTIEVYAVK